MKLTKDQTDALERVHKAFTEFNEAVRCLGVKGFKLRIARSEKGAFHPFEVKSIIHSQPLTMQDVKEAIADRMRNEGSTQAPQKATTAGDIAAARRPTGATNGVTDGDACTVKRSDLCEFEGCYVAKEKGMTMCVAHIGVGTPKA